MMECFLDSSFLDLETINDVKFSLREVDMLSCIVNGRSPKFIAHLLDISPKTVEAHIRNIKIKMKCSSKEQMVSFIEKSDKYQLVSQHYRNLIVNSEFEKSLRDISAELTDKNLELRIICLIENHTEKCIKCCKIIKHLSMSGIKANIEYKNTNDLDFKINKYILLCSVKAAQEIYEKHKEQIKNTIFFTNGSLDMGQKSQSISYVSPNNYYSAILELISKFYSSKQVELLISRFKRLHDSRLSDFYTEAPITEDKYLRDKYKIFIILGLISTLFVYSYFYTSHRSKDVCVSLYSQLIGNDILLPRKNLIRKIDEVFEKQNGIKYVILTGDGGIGKTVIARHYLQLNDFKIKAEINAETENSLSDSFTNLATVLADSKELQEKLSYIQAITDYKRRDKQVFLFVLSRLRKVGNWCLLFDNIDDFNLIRDFIPNNDYSHNEGRIIITSRNKNFENITVFPKFCVINVPLLTANEQEELFSKIIYGKSKENNIVDQSVKNFLKDIPSMPLDVCAAAYYLRNTELSLGDYENIMATSCKELSKAQKLLLEENVNYSKTRYSIISSIFEKILKENPKFRILLLVLCLLDSQAIPKWLFRSCSDSVTADRFVHDLRKNSLITSNKDNLSIHRSSQNVGLDYMINVLNSDEKSQIIKTLADILTPYEKLEKTKCDLLKMIPHMESLLSKLSKVGCQNSVVDLYRIKLLLTLAKIYEEDAYRVADALKYFKEALKINNDNYLNKTEVARINLGIGEIYTFTGKDDEALKYLDESLKFLQSDPIELSRCYRFIGIVKMRQNQFHEANRYYQKAIEILNREDDNDIFVKEKKSNIYADMAFNYHMNGINRNDAQKGAEIMEKAVDILSSVEKEEKQKIIGHLVIHMSRLAGIYNALGKYDLAFKTIQEAENITGKVSSKDSDLLYAQGIIFREKGLANLRLNKIETAYNYFSKAKEIFAQAGVSSYLFRLKTHEIETLIRLNRLAEAFEICKSMFSTKDRERNNYSDLFFNTCYYHAAIIKLRQKDFDSAREYFRNFFCSMRVLCKNILEREKFQQLRKNDVFNENASDLKKCLQNSLQIFEEIYYKGCEFIKYYVEENLNLLPKKN